MGNNCKKNIVSFFFDVPLELVNSNLVATDSELIISKCGEKNYRIFYNFYDKCGNWYTTRTMALDDNLSVYDLLVLFECANKYSIPIKCDLNWYEKTGKAFIQSKNIFEIEELNAFAGSFISHRKE